MAVVVPILLSATGASAAIGAAVGLSAGLVTAAAGVLVGATGIGKSINKAASKVFGEDLVSFANLAGGIAMAAGWNPGQTWSSITGSAGGGALSADISTTDIGIGATSTGAASGVQPPLTGTTTTGGAQGGALSTAPQQPVTAGGVDGLRELERAGVNANLPGQEAPVGPKAGTGALSTAVEWFNKQPERVKAAVITTGGQALAGAAQGLGRSQDQAAERRERRRREGLFQSGSGTNFAYGPKAPVTGG